MTSLVKGRRKTLSWFVPFLLTAHRQYNETLIQTVIMPLDLTLPCFLLAFGKKIRLFSLFLQQMISIRPTREVCFPFNLVDQE